MTDIDTIKAEIKDIWLALRHNRNALYCVIKAMEEASKRIEFLEEMLGKNKFKETKGSDNDPGRS